MTWFVPLLLALAVFATLVSIGIGFDRMRHYSSARAELVHSDYSISARHYDHLSDWTDGMRPPRRVSMRIAFRTPAGQEIRANHKRWEFRGERQKSFCSVWFHRDNPEKTTAYGPGFWLLVAAVCACLGVMVVLDPAWWMEAFGLAG